MTGDHPPRPSEHTERDGNETATDPAPAVLAARETSGRLLAEVLPRRWAHSQGVARQARTLAPALGSAAAGLVEAAAWVHDIGYAPDLATTGLHALDGARWLRDHPDGQSVGGPIVWHLVAHHTGAVVEAGERGLRAVLLAEFPTPSDRTIGPDPDHGESGGVAGGDVVDGWTLAELVEAITWCDVTTTPTGEVTEPAARLAEILDRYTDGDPVHRAVTRSRPGLLAQCARVQERLRQAQTR